jgi:Hint module
VQETTNGRCSTSATYSTMTTSSVATNGDSSRLMKSCFAGSETVTLESGETKPISEVRVGDRVVAADSSRATVFSEVVFVPHERNTEKTLFTHIFTTHGRNIKMSGSHIIPAGACGLYSPLPDVYASSVTVGDCIMTVSGMEEVSAVEMIQGQGLYTVVTKEEYVVVNGIIASPFAHNHMLANSYYNIHRFIYACVPGLLAFPLVHSVNEVKGSVYWLSHEIVICLYLCSATIDDSSKLCHQSILQHYYAL